ncbi:MAG TPA: peptidylprolyl isomerase [Bacteroidales bacterium]|nr:peptidylprolyl isomerase [Bacteroidales bacterium]
MKVGKNKVITMTYILSKDDVNGELVQEVTKDKPFVVLFGAGSLLPKFEENLEGLSIGDTFGFSLSSAEGYGEKTPEAIVDLDKQIFEFEGEIDEEFLKVGANIPMQNEEGHPLTGLVLEIGEDFVKMDFNHPLAGQTLYFTGEIVDVREASEEELDHGHVHGHGGHHH